jgi:hypothetical protein
MALSGPKLPVMKVSFAILGCASGTRNKSVDNTKAWGAIVEARERQRRQWDFRAMNEEAVVVAEELTSEVSDEALETAAGNEARFAWTNICTGIQCPG